MEKDLGTAPDRPGELGLARNGVRLEERRSEAPQDEWSNLRLRSTPLVDDASKELTRVDVEELSTTR